MRRYQACAAEGREATLHRSMLATVAVAAVLTAEFVAKALADRQGVQQVAIISLNPTTSVNHPRTNDLTETLAKNPKVKVVADISGHQTLEGGFTAAQAILSAHPQVAAIY